MAVMRYGISHIKINPRDVRGEIPLIRERPRRHCDVTRGHKPEPGRGRSAPRLTRNTVTLSVNPLILLWILVFLPIACVTYLSRLPPVSCNKLRVWYLAHAL